MANGDLRSEIDRAALPLVALALLASESAHGYALIQKLKSHGFARIQGGTLYPLLRRLEERGLVNHEWRQDDSGPGRKEFSITNTGRAELAMAQDEWRRVALLIEERTQ